jgi:adenylate kinase
MSVSLNAMPAAADGPFVIMLGAPGAGKSTASEHISDSTGVAVVEVGEMLRKELAEASKTKYAGRPGTARSKAHAERRRAIEEAKDKLDAGLLVDDRAIDSAVAIRILSPETGEGFVLDGYPGSIEQAKFLDGLLDSRGVEPMVIFLEVPDEVALDRMKSRGRVDDKYGIAEQRLEAFNANVKPILEYYEDAGLHRIDATQSISEVLKDVDEVVGQQ